MIKNYLKTAFRNFRKSKSYALVNVVGLAVGIACCLLLAQYVAYERSYDKFHKSAGRIVRLRLDFHDQGKLTMQSAAVYPGVPAMMKKEFADVENFCRLIDTRISWLKDEMVQANIVLANEERDITGIENKGYYADPSFLDMFTVPLLKGDAHSSLDGANKIIISETLANKYFGKADPLGNNITVREGGNTYHYLVTGVFRDYPSNSHLAFDYLISYRTFDNLIHSLGAPAWADPETSLNWYDFYDYLQLRPETDWQQFQKKVTAFSNRYLNNDFSRAHNNRQDLYIIPMQDIHLYSHANEEAGINGDGRSVSFLFLIAFLIIIIAWVNYANLATTRSLERAREVGVRKVLGALRKDLVGQFLTESLLLNLAALLLGAGLVACLSPFFNTLMGSKSLTLHLPAPYWQEFVLLFCGGAFLSGLYPAFVLSGYQAGLVLKGSFKKSVKGMLVRKGLIIGQFATSIVLIAGTLVISQQVRFMLRQKPGVDISQTLVLNGPTLDPNASYKTSFQPFRNDVLRLSGVRDIAASSSVMGKEIYLSNGAYLVNTKEKNPLTLYSLYVDEHFLSAYGASFKAGRNFSPDNTNDRRAVILNEEAAKLFGIPEPTKALDQLIYNFHDTLRVIGVVADYHQLGLSRSILPTLFVLKPEVNNFYSIKLTTSGVPQTIASIKNAWEQHFPSDPFSYFFLDDAFNNQYKSDQQFGKVFGLFSLIAVMIACFGLLSLSAHNVLQRTKEIGIRKVLGAPVSNLVFILSRDFLALVLIGFLIAIPVAWWIMSRWLNDFAYRIRINGWVFVLAGCIAMVIAMVTIGVQSIRAAIANPVRSLRTE